MQAYKMTCAQQHAAKACRLQLCRAPTVLQRPVLRSVKACFKHGESDGKDSEGSPAIVYTAMDPEHGGICPHSQAALIALLEKRRAFREVRVDLAAKPSEFVDLYHSIVTDKAAKEHVPLLVDGQTRLVDATIIAEYLARQYPAEGAPLLPPDATSQALVSLFIHFFQDTVVPPFLHLLHVEGQQLESEAKEQLMSALAALDDFLALHGGYQGDRALGPHYSWSMHEEEPGTPTADSALRSHSYFMGPYYSLAEVVCTPWVARMVEVLPEWRGWDLLAACEQARLTRVQDWVAACLARPSAAATCPAKEQLVEGLAAREWSHAT